MCESEGPATQVHADSDWKTRLYQKQVIAAQDKAHHFALEGGSVCHHAWGLLLMARAPTSSLSSHASPAPPLYQPS